MAESLRAHGGDAGSTGVAPADEEDMDEFVTPPSTTQRLPATGPPVGSSTTMPGAFSGPAGDRRYDDEDAELQAALKASLEHSGGTGGGLTIPSVPAAPVRAPAVSAPAPAAQTRPEEDDEDEEDDDEEEEQTPAPMSPEAKAEVADPEEMRRRRLARFGG